MTGGQDRLEDQIKKQINNSGFPLEIFVSIMLKKHQWSVRPSITYYDKIIEDYRESDIIAYKKSEIEHISNFLVIECKKSTKNPWVFIKQNREGNLSENLNLVVPHLIYELKSFSVRISTNQ